MHMPSADCSSVPMLGRSLCNPSDSPFLFIVFDINADLKDSAVFNSEYTP